MEQIIKEYLRGGSPVSYLLSKDKVKRWLQTLKRRFWVSHHVWFGNLNDLGEYGICSTEGEYAYSLTRYFSFIKGNIIRATDLKSEAVAKGFLLKSFKDKPYLLPEPISAAGKRKKE